MVAGPRTPGLPRRARRRPPSRCDAVTRAYSMRPGPNPGLVLAESPQRVCRRRRPVLTASSKPTSIMLRTVAHLAAAGYYVWLLLFVFALEVAPAADAEGREALDARTVDKYTEFRPRFFSVWAMVAQVVLLTLCLADDAGRLLGQPDFGKLRTIASRLRDIFFAGCAAPLAMTGFLMYAGLCLWDRDLVMPPDLDALLPPWLNQAMHSVSAALVVLQLLTDPLGVPCLGAAASLASVVGGVYILVTLDEYVRTGRWLYPFLSVMGWPGRVALAGFFLGGLLVQAAAFKTAIQARWGGGVPSGCPMARKK